MLVEAVVSPVLVYRIHAHVIDIRVFQLLFGRLPKMTLFWVKGKKKTENSRRPVDVDRNVRILDVTVENLAGFGYGWTQYRVAVLWEFSIEIISRGRSLN